MTGRDLIIYILENKLENKPINEVCCLKNFMTVEQAAAKYNVGVETIKVWFTQGDISGMQIGETIYISREKEPTLTVETPGVSDTFLMEFTRKYHESASRSIARNSRL